MNEPLITVVIPAYNDERFLAKTLDSVLTQTFARWECIVVNDGSKDGTETIGRSYAAMDSRIRVLNQRNQGAAAARNLGFSSRSASSQCVAFLDHDDVWRPIALEVLWAGLEKHSDAVAVHGGGSYIDEQGLPTRVGELERVSQQRLTMAAGRITRCDAGAPTSFETLAVACSIFTPGMVLIRCAAFSEIGGFDPNFRYSADWECWVRLSRLSSIPFVEIPVIGYRQLRGNMGSNRKLSLREVQKVRHLIMCSRDNTPEQQRFGRRAYRAFYLFMWRERSGCAYRAIMRGEFGTALRYLKLSTANCAMGLVGGLLNRLFVQVAPPASKDARLHFSPVPAPAPSSPAIVAANA
jgi:glycosyltransferase involved in cell wall biosynthesis